MNFYEHLLIICVLILLAELCQAWWCTGHMLVSLIASQQFTAKTSSQVTSLISLLSNEYPTSPEPVAAACWADDLRDVESIQMQFNWHFIDLPVVKSALLSGSPAVDRQNNVQWAIESCRGILNSSTTTSLSKALYLRFVIHFVGDVHQPLHTAALLDDILFPPPDGDQGGNKFRIRGANVTNLHSFWDSGAGLWAADPERPLQPDGWALLKDWAARLQAQYPTNAFVPDLALPTAAEWVAQSHQLAEQVAYSLQPDSTLSPAYIDTARQLVQRQVTLGGYRLAQLLNNVFDPAN